MNTLSKVFKTARAILDLDEIWFYIATDNIAAADGVIDAIGETSSHLARQPMMGRARPELLFDDLRSFPVGRYVLFYRPVADGIEIVRVIHTARDIAEIEHAGGFDVN